LLQKGAETVNCLAFSPDGKWLATGGHDKKVRVYDLDGKAAPVVVREHAKKILALAFSADGKTVVSASDDLLVFRSAVKP
jgi:WD40 repeat protein